MQIIVLNGTLTEEEQDACIKEVSAIHPIHTIDKLFLDVQDDGVRFRCEFHQFREMRKMGGYCIGCPSDWNLSKQAELRDTIPNHL